MEELPDKSLRAVDLPDPDRLIKEFWDIVNNPNKTSVNILSNNDVFVQEVEVGQAEAGSGTKYAPPKQRIRDWPQWPVPSLISADIPP